MFRLKFVWLLCLLPIIFSAGEPVYIRTEDDAKASPYDNLCIGVPVFTDYVVDREWFSFGFSRKYRQVLWVQYRLLASEVENKVVERLKNFHKDDLIPESLVPADFGRSGFDRGHMVPAGDMRWSPGAMFDSFAMSNISPQHPQCNRKIWKYLEEQIRIWAIVEKELYVICGPIFKADSFALANGIIPVPEAFYKIIYDVTPPQKMIAFLIPNRETEQSLCSFTVTVRELEKITGYDFFSFLPKQFQEYLESTVFVSNWTWKKICH